MLLEIGARRRRRRLGQGKRKKQRRLGKMGTSVEGAEIGRRRVFFIRA